MRSYLLETNRRGSRLASAAAVALAVAAVGLVVFAARWKRHPEGAAEASPPAPPTAAAQAPAPTAAPPAPATGPVRPRALLEAVSASPLFRRTLGEGDSLRRLAILTDNLAEGVSPREQLGFLAPHGAFTVADRGGETVIAHASYARYDAFADLVASVDAKAAAAAYRPLHALLEAAYRALGYPDASLDAVVARALRRIEAAPVRDGDVVVEPEGGLFEFADPRLRESGEVEKHLLRMGPRNTRILQAKARALDEALGLAGQVAAHP
jgi:Protein of unknown function (DUF3014)